MIDDCILLSEIKKKNWYPTLVQILISSPFYFSIRMWRRSFSFQLIPPFFAAHISLADHRNRIKRFTTHGCRVGRYCVVEKSLSLLNHACWEITDVIPVALFARSIIKISLERFLTPELSTSRRRSAPPRFRESLHFVVFGLAVPILIRAIRVKNKIFVWVTREQKGEGRWRD